MRWLTGLWSLLFREASDAWILAQSGSFCSMCGRRFLDQRGLVWHAQASHIDTYDKHMEGRNGA